MNFVDFPCKMQEIPHVSPDKPNKPMPTRNTYYLPGGTDPEDREAAKLAFSERLRSAMNSMSMSQSDLARAAGLKRDVISTYINGKVWPNPQNLRKVANALHLAPSELIPGMSEISEAKASPAPLMMKVHTPTPFGMEALPSGDYRVRLDRVVTKKVALQLFEIASLPDPQ